MWGLNIKYPDNTFCEYFKSINVDVGKTGKETFEVSPRHSELRKKASENLEKAVNSLIKGRKKQVGEAQVCELEKWCMCD